jgi:predicted RNA-binding Zn-ribbon protein involved in translation (DUF1610 family)
MAMMGYQRQPDFQDLQATQLYCPKCGGAMPVRKKLLLVLLDKEIHDFVCAGCGASLGKKEEPAMLGAPPAFRGGPR